MPNPVSVSVGFKGVSQDDQSYNWIVEFSIVAQGYENAISIPVDRNTDPGQIVAEGQATLHQILQRAAEETKDWAQP